jgi:hypothetical protein
VAAVGQQASAIHGNILPGFGEMLEHDPEKWKPVFRKDYAPLRI